MSLLRLHFDPFTEFDRLFDDAFNASLYSTVPSCQRAASQRPDSFRPRLDLHESKDANLVTATFELPGLTSEDVTIDLHHDRLTVSGASTASDVHEEPQAGYAVRAGRYGKFSRTLQVPFGTKAEDVKAKVENGLLTLTFPKLTEGRPQQIAIE